MKKIWKIKISFVSLLRQTIKMIIMATKCIVLENGKKLTSIEFHQFICISDGVLSLVPDSSVDVNSASSWDVVELLCLNYKGSGFDLMFAYDGDRNTGQQCLFIGKWNDGVV